MKELKVSEYFCKDLVNFIIYDITNENDLIEFESYKNHLSKCKFCAEGIKKIVFNFSKEISLIDLYNAFKNK